MGKFKLGDTPLERPEPPSEPASEPAAGPSEPIEEPKPAEKPFQPIQVGKDLEESLSKIPNRIIALIDIIVDQKVQARAALSEETIAEYAEAMLKGDKFPAVVVFEGSDGLVLADGVHRYEARKRAGKFAEYAERAGNFAEYAEPGKFTDIECHVIQGTLRDAILFACGANATHGLRLTNADKRFAATKLLLDEEWSKWSSNIIAKHCGVSHTLVDAIRASLATAASETKTRMTRTKHGTTTTMNTGKIGKKELKAREAAKQKRHEAKRAKEEEERKKLREEELAKWEGQRPKNFAEVATRLREMWNKDDKEECLNPKDYDDEECLDPKDSAFNLINKIYKMAEDLTDVSCRIPWLAYKYGPPNFEDAIDWLLEHEAERTDVLEYIAALKTFLTGIEEKLKVTIQ